MRGTLSYFPLGTVHLARVRPFRKRRCLPDIFPFHVADRVLVYRTFERPIRLKRSTGSRPDGTNDLVRLDQLFTREVD